jgi:hypothetical protein
VRIQNGRGFSASSPIKFVMDMLKKMRVRSRLLSDSDKEEFAIGQLVRQADRKKKVSKKAFLKKLALP